jgi:hypothetical protein
LKGWRDVSQVHAYTVAAGSVGGIVGLYLDLSAGGVEQEVVRGSRLRKAMPLSPRFSAASSRTRRRRAPSRSRSYKMPHKSVTEKSKDNALRINCTRASA